jgi:hypothetical protein
MYINQMKINKLNKRAFALKKIMLENQGEEIKTKSTQLINLTIN